ncbi:MAG: helix-turn-helix domain-containing protein [Patescibacteria group bacterium]
MIHSLKRSFSFSKNVKVRAQWFDYFKQTQNVSQTCKHFGISRKTFYKWKKRYDPFNLFTLEDYNGLVNFR